MTESQTQTFTLGLPFRARSRLMALLIVVSALSVGAFLSWHFSRFATTTLSPPKLAQRADRTNTSRWLYGHPEARFSVLEYADLECPYCRAYFPVLRQWIDLHPQVNWEWHYLPLSVHDPAATREARLAECAGEVGGTRAFWRSLAWIYEHTDGDGSGLPAGVELPGTNQELRACMASTRPDAVVRSHVQAAAAEKIEVTPTLRLEDHRSGKTLTLHGPVEGDSLLSAFDLLASE